jgi:hypothetical protein
MLNTSTKFTLLSGVHSSHISTSNDKLNVELLHMASLIVQYWHNLVADQRKEIIKFGGYFLSLRDNQTVKNAAYILISCFIVVYYSPTKIDIFLSCIISTQQSFETPSLFFPIVMFLSLTFAPPYPG